MVQQNMVYPHNIVLFSNKKKGNSDTSQALTANIMYDSIYMKDPEQEIHRAKK